MARAFFSVAEILAIGSPTLPSDKGGLSRLIEERGWRNDPLKAEFEPGRGREGGTWRYHIALMPSEVRAALLAGEYAASALVQPERKPASKALWAAFEALPEKLQGEARGKLARVDQVDTLSATMPRQAAVALVAKEAAISTSTLWGWLRAAAGVDREDRLAALAPRHKGRQATSACDPRAWDFLVADYLRPEQPSFDACHRRMRAAADRHEWAPIPSAKTLKRRLDRDFPRSVQVLSRKGAQAAKALYPHQTRDRDSLSAMEAVNADGHRFDVFVTWEDGTIGRPMMTAFQDVYSGMLLAHRIDRSENWTAVRLCLADMIESFGIPEHTIFDNGRPFASKWLSGGVQTRYRFKIRDEDPRGILPMLGVEVHFATPYHGQAKPIERAFRDLCEEIAKHPACAGAYTGNKPDAKPENYGSKALPIETFRALVAQEIARHNQRSGRRSLSARGRSFAETFAESYRDSPIRRALPEQRRLLLMAAEGVTASRRTGEVMLGENRYWAEPLLQLAGRKVTVRFDPQDLSLPLAIYRMDGRFVCEAECIELSGFLDMDAAREHARLKRAWFKNQRECQALERRMTIDQVAALLPAPEPTEPPVSGVIRLVANGMPRQAEPAIEPGADWDEAASFSRGLSRVFGADAEILPFRKEEGGRG